MQVHTVLRWGLEVVVPPAAQCGKVWVKRGVKEKTFNPHICSSKKEQILL